jgi:hypothetical protein
MLQKFLGLDPGGIRGKNEKGTRKKEEKNMK